MKITKIYTESYRWEKKKVYFSGRGKGTHAYRYNNLTILYVETDEGLTGIGTGMNIDKLPQFESMLIGMDPLCIEGIYQKMTDPNNHGLKNCIGTIAAIDIALWDLKAKYAKMPLYKLLGGVRNKVDCYVAGGYYMEGKTTLDLQYEMEGYIKDNARAVKMKVGGLSPYEDAERVRAVREAIGPDVKLLVDANCAWRIHEALEFAKRAEEFNLYWFEEPLAAKDFDNYKRLSEHTLTPLAGGESLQLLDDEIALIDRGGVAFSQPDACGCGGISMIMKLGHYVEAKHINIAPHGNQQCHIHLNCAMPNAVITEFYSTTVNEFAYSAYKYPVQINDDGTVSPSEEPGANLDINKDVLAPYRVG